jgi:hypothetical protein
MVSKKKMHVYIVFGITMVLLFGSLWWIKQTTLHEPFDNVWTSIAKTAVEKSVPAILYVHENTKYINIGDENHMRAQTDNISYLASLKNPSAVESIQLAAYDPSVLRNDRTIRVTDPNITGMSTLAGDDDYSLSEITTDILNENPRQNIQWDSVRLDITRKNKLTVVPKYDPPIILSDSCSKKGLLYSEFKEDICDLYSRDMVKLNAKCQKLSAENCKIPSCCVLLNGTNCVAGNFNGPIFTKDDSDYTYYYNKEVCYGDCSQAQSYESACSQYDKNSTGISKSCMVQMFNNHGCPNKNPDAFINDDMVATYSNTTKQYVDNYIKTSVDQLKFLKVAELCDGDTGKPKADADANSDSDSNRGPVDSVEGAAGVAKSAFSSITSSF